MNKIESQTPSISELDKSPEAPIPSANKKAVLNQPRENTLKSRRRAKIINSSTRKSFHKEKSTPFMEKSSLLEAESPSVQEIEDETKISSPKISKKQSSPPIVIRKKKADKPPPKTRPTREPKKPIEFVESTFTPFTTEDKDDRLMIWPTKDIEQDMKELGLPNMNNNTSNTIYLKDAIVLQEIYGLANDVIISIFLNILWIRMYLKHYLKDIPVTEMEPAYPAQEVQILSTYFWCHDILDLIRVIIFFFFEDFIIKN